MDLNSTPRLAPGCRLHPTEAVLLIPEGALNLEGPAHDILFHLDGKRSVAAIVDELLKQYSDVDSDDMRQDVLGLLQRMEQRGVVRCGSGRV
ncbi:pyrroloquinoline quinone biosynthesis peptide chaperone PqqD [Acidicapsa ligni]|uniref:pyrroloquinoline quinone biosynthesis peptide chaperone PqqD n=1 Tax=Acidicapsa ligni TaxID=542300 RepID=UPI0021E04F7C|nr:pyrroloquinoline quinone biosynthesis peptide chaperone PqqD [Acidicapsa ligni]